MKDGKPETLDEIVKAFLEIALGYDGDHPVPKQEYRRREGRAMMIGYYRAQEDLRSILKHCGFEALSKTRSPKQEQPEEIGGMRLWPM